MAMAAGAHLPVMVALGATIHDFDAAGTGTCVNGRPSPTMTQEDRAGAREHT